MITVEARAASHVPWTVQDGSREGSLQGDNQGSGSGFLRCIKRAFCPCFVRDPETVELVIPGQGNIHLNLGDPRLGERYVNQYVSECLPENASYTDRQRMRTTVIHSIVAGMIMEQTPAYQQSSVEATEPDVIDSEHLQILKSNIVPFNELPDLPADISRKEISKKCYIAYDEVPDLVFWNGHSISYETLAEHYIHSNGLDPMRMPINWKEVYKVG
ncbi:hypothetical protein [Endozoicomonas atrinae]|uniref:hypothetical protein n=1 Tax=Endozoicomonas atrinae TaxID=1333660 RepID=UPI003AFF7211